MRSDARTAKKARTARIDRRSTSVALAKACIATSLSVLMAAPQSMAEAPARAASTTEQGSSRMSARSAPLTPAEKDLHLLNRMTFGPRPGDEAAVKKMGLAQWLAWQLHPEKIDDGALDAKLAEFPALQLSIGEMLTKYPSPGMLRQIARTGAPLPSDPVEHAIYADGLAFNRKALEAAAQANSAKDQTNAAGGTGAPVDSASMNGLRSITPDAASMDSSLPGSEVLAKNGKPRMNVQRLPQPQMQALLALPADARFQQLVAMSPEAMVGLRRGMKPLQQIALGEGMTPEQKQDVLAMEGGERLIGGEALGERILRDVYSERQVQAVMDDFWLNHFSVYARKNQNEPYYLASYDRDAVLPNALGSFEKLLVATAESPAILMYLDNWQSIGPDSPAAQRGKRFANAGLQANATPQAKLAQALPKGINENYARELMELHTLGVGGGYTQQDVIEVAKCFTGWTISRPYGVGGAGRFAQQSGAPGEFIFEPNRHEGGSKTVLGHVIPEGGMKEGLAVLHILATSPATAHFISNKLAVRFVSDTPPAALVDRMAATFLKSNGDIKAVLTTMVDSPEFFSPAVYRVKVKTPIEFLASALRASEAQIQSPLALVQAMNGLGMPIYGMQTPNGYSWLADGWVSSNALVSRMNFALVLSAGRIPGATIRWPSVLGDSTDSTIATAPTPGTEAQLETIVLGEPAAPHTRQTVLANYNDPAVQQQAAANFTHTSQAADTAQPPAMSDDRNADSMNAGSMKAMRAAYGKKAGVAGGQYLLDKPQTPLDTMAGLLIGSPDFQKR
jgi:uncharacterized protein (DUF1800 family)